MFGDKLLVTLFDKATFVSKSPSAEQLEAPAACQHGPGVCKDQGTKTLTMYRVHQANDLTLEDRNTGTVGGDLSFFCWNPDNAEVSNKVRLFRICVPRDSRGKPG